MALWSDDGILQEPALFINKDRNNDRRRDEPRPAAPETSGDPPRHDHGNGGAGEGGRPETPETARRSASMSGAYHVIKAVGNYGEMFDRNLVERHHTRTRSEQALDGGRPHLRTAAPMTTSTRRPGTTQRIP